MAAPVVSGVAALVQEAFPYMGGKQIADVLFSTADKNFGDFSDYMVQYGDDETRFLFFGTEDGFGREWTEEEKTNKVREVLEDESYSCSDGIVCNDVSYADVFGQGLINAGEAVKGPKYLDPKRLTTADYDSSRQQYFYSVNTAGYDSVWSNNLSPKEEAGEETPAKVGLKKQGAGSLTLAGDNNVLNGISSVEEGTLTLSGSLNGKVLVNGGIFMMSGGTLTDTLTVNSGGTLKFNNGTVATTINNLGTTVAVNGTVTGQITNRGTFSVAGLSENGVLTPGDFTAEKPVLNKKTFRFTKSGNLSGTLNNEATVSVTGNSGLTGTLNNKSSGKMVVDTSAIINVTGSVENDGSISGFGKISGTVHNKTQGSVDSSLKIGTLNSEGNINLISSGDKPAVMTVDTLNITGGKLALAENNYSYHTKHTYTVIDFDECPTFNNFEMETYFSPFIVARSTLNNEEKKLNMEVEFKRTSTSEHVSYYSPEERGVLKIVDKLYIDEEKADFNVLYYHSGEDLRKQINIIRDKARPIQAEKLPLTKVMTSQVHAHLFSNMMIRDATKIDYPYTPSHQYQGRYFQGRSGGGADENQKIWGQILSSRTTENGDSYLNQSDSKTKMIGAMFGYDYNFSDKFLVGLTAGAASAYLKQDGNEVHLKDYRAGIYTGSRLGRFTLNTLLMGGLQKYETDRQTLLFDSILKNKAHFNGYSGEFNLTLGYDFMRLPYRDHSFYLRSYLSANVNYIHQDAYEETGSTFFALGVNSSHNTSVSVSPGLTLGYTFTQAVLTADISYQRLLSGDSVHSSVYFLADTAKETFSSLSSDTDKNYMNAGLEFKTNLNRNLQAQFRAGTRISKNTETLDFSFSLAYTF